MIKIYNFRANHHLNVHNQIMKIETNQILAADFFLIIINLKN